VLHALPSHPEYTRLYGVKPVKTLLFIIIVVYAEKPEIYINILCGQNAEIRMLKRGVHTITCTLQGVSGKMVGEMWYTSIEHRRNGIESSSGNCANVAAFCENGRHENKQNREEWP
jgi:hypothetical protein